MIASRQAAASAGSDGGGDGERCLQRVPGQVGQRLGRREQVQLAGQVAAGDGDELAPVGAAGRHRAGR